MRVIAHYIELVNPGNECLTHVTPKSGHDKGIAQAIFDFLVEHL